MSNVLCAFLAFTIDPYGMTIRDSILTRIAIFVDFSLPNILHESRPEQKSTLRSKRCLRAQRIERERKDIV